MPYTVRGAIEPLLAGKTVEVRGIGNSMTPLITSGEVVLVAPLAADEHPVKGDVVLARVRGQVYLHLVHAVRGEMIQIGNNHGHINGWTARSNIFGRRKKP